MSIMALARVRALPKRPQRGKEMEDGYKLRHFNKSLFVFWIVSYASILLIPILFACITYYTAVDTLEQEIGETNAAMLENIRQVIDGKIDKIYELGTQFSLEPQIKALVSDASHLTQDQRMNIYRLQRNYLKPYTTAYSEIEDIYLYLPSQGYVFSTYNSFSVRGQNRLATAEPLSPADWHYEVEDYHDASYQLLPVYQHTDKVAETIAYFTSLPWEFSLQNRLLMVVVMDRQSILDILQDTRWLGHSTVTILDGDGRPLLSSGEELPEDFGALYGQMEDSTTTLTLGGEEMVVTSVSSKAVDWKYVFITPKSLYHSKMGEVSSTFTTCIAVSILFGGVLSIIFIRKNYTPVKGLVRVLAQNEEQALRSHMEMDQYQFIEQSIIQNISERQNIQARLDRQEQQQMEVWLYKILTGSLQQTDRFNEFCTDNFLADSFGILLMQPRRAGAEAMDEITRVLGKVLEESPMLDSCAWFVVEIERRLVCLLNFNSFGGVATTVALGAVAHQMFSTLELESEIGVRLAVSTVYQTVAGITDAYSEAREAIEYLNMIDAEDRVITSTEVRDMSSKHQYSLQTEQLLINCVKL